MLDLFTVSRSGLLDTEKEFQAAIGVAPQDPLRGPLLPDFYYSQGQVAQAEQVLTDAKNQLGSNPAAYIMLGNAYLAHGQMDKALAEFSSLSANYPDDLSVRRPIPNC